VRSLYATKKNQHHHHQHLTQAVNPYRTVVLIPYDRYLKATVGVNVILMLFSWLFSCCSKRKRARDTDDEQEVLPIPVTKHARFTQHHIVEADGTVLPRTPLTPFSSSASPSSITGRSIVLRSQAVDLLPSDETAQLKDAYRKQHAM